MEKIEVFTIWKDANREVLRLNTDGSVTISGDLYQAAKDFWDIVAQFPGKELSIKE